MTRTLLTLALGAATLATAAPALAQPYGPPGPPPPAPHGDRMGGYAFGRDFWRGAPESPWERVQWLQQRIDRGRQEGSLNPREAMRVQRELDRVRNYIRDARHRYGELRPQDRAWVQTTLDNTSQRIRWARHNGM